VSDSRHEAAVAAGVAGAEEAFAALLTSIVDVARAIFAARASSILLLEDETDELRFAAVSGDGQDELVGRRFPAGHGIAGFVLTTGQPLLIEDVQADPRFARDFAQGTGYVPRSLAAVPLLVGEDVLGVLEVLDRDGGAPFGLAEIDLLGRFAAQAAIALELSRRVRRARATLDGDAELSVLARLAERVAALDESRRPAALDLLRALERTLAP
jgi:GAF domain-containing protein